MPTERRRNGIANGTGLQGPSQSQSPKHLTKHQVLSKGPQQARDPKTEPIPIPIPIPRPEGGKCGTKNLEVAVAGEMRSFDLPSKLIMMSNLVNNNIFKFNFNMTSGRTALLFVEYWCYYYY